MERPHVRVCVSIPALHGRKRIVLRMGCARDDRDTRTCNSFSNDFHSNIRTCNSNFSNFHSYDTGHCDCCNSDCNFHIRRNCHGLLPVHDLRLHCERSCDCSNKESGPHFDSF